MTIGSLARSGGVGVETIRYYQGRGLLPKPERDGGIRRYGSEDLRRLRFIRAAQTAGFTLEEIGELLSLNACEDRARVQAIAAHRLSELDARIAALQSARNGLARLETACRSDSAGPCPILAAFEVAG